MLLKIEQNTYNSSSGYKIETVQQLNSYRISTKQVNNYKTWTSPSYKDCKEIVVETRNMELSLKKASIKKEVLEKKLCFKLKGQPPLNRQNFRANSTMNNKSE